MQAEKEAHAMKQAKKEEEERIEKEFRRTMMEKFAQDEKLEQLSMQKRRMKELEHKKEVFFLNYIPKFPNRLKDYGKKDLQSTEQKEKRKNWSTNARRKRKE